MPPAKFPVMMRDVRRSRSPPGTPATWRPPAKAIPLGQAGSEQLPAQPPPPRAPAAAAETFAAAAADTAAGAATPAFPEGFPPAPPAFAAAGAAVHHQAVGFFGDDPWADRWLMARSVCSIHSVNAPLPSTDSQCQRETLLRIRRVEEMLAEVLDHMRFNEVLPRYPEPGP
jgi:hypothetical protein